MTDLTNISQAIFSLSKHFVSISKIKLNAFKTDGLLLQWLKKWKNTDTLFMNNVRP